jgi:hypothetical protein
MVFVYGWYLVTKRIGGNFKKIKLLEFDNLSQTNLLISFLFIVLFLGSTFMMHNRSSFIWAYFPILEYAQFPWRFLGVTIFAASLVGGSLIYFLNKKIQIWAVLIIVVLSVAFNFSYFKPQQFLFNVTDEQKLTGDEWVVQQKSIIGDYLPVGARAPQSLAESKPIIVLGKGEVYSYQKTTKKWQTDVDLQQQSIIEIPVYDFPVWEIEANGTRIGHQKSVNLGRIQVQLMPGKYHIQGRFEDTQIRKFSNIVTLGSFIILILYGIFAPVYEREFLKTFKKN